MGTILIQNLSRRYLECGVSATISLRNPSAINEEPVSPGCTLAEMISKSLLFWFPKVIRGMVLPSKLVPRAVTFTLGRSWEIKRLSF